MTTHPCPSPSSTGKGRIGGDNADRRGRPAASASPSTGQGGLNLDWITPDLAVGGGFANHEIERLATLGIGGVVDLRSEAKDDAAQLARHGMTLLHLPTEDHRAVSQGMLEEGVAFALDRLQHGERVLIHCREGIGRSVTLALCLLCALGREPLAAMAEIKDRRPPASPSPAQFEAWAGWLHGRGLTPPHFGDFAAIAYRHLKRG